MDYLICIKVILFKFFNVCDKYGYLNEILGKKMIIMIF